MKSYVKYGISAVALLASFSLAQAQQYQGGSEKGGAQQMQGGKEGGATMQHQGTMQNKGAMENKGAEANEKGTARERSAKEERGKVENRTEAERGNKAQERGERGQMRPENRAEAERGNKAEEQGERGKTQPENRAETQAKGQRSAKNVPMEQQRERSQQREGERNAQGAETRQGETNIGGTARNENLGRQKAPGRRYAAIHISGAQKTRLHDAIRHDTSIHRYSRGQIGFSPVAGTVIPGGFELYSPPPTFVEVDPELRYYKIVVVGDEILVVDPVSREIVDVIPV